MFLECSFKTQLLVLGVHLLFSVRTNPNGKQKYDILIDRYLGPQEKKRDLKQISTCTIQAMFTDEH